MIKYLGRFLEDGLSLTVGTDLFLGFRPDDAPVDCDVLLEREGGRAEAAPFTDHIDWRVQILSRAESYFVAKARSQAVFDLMHSQCGVYFPDPDTDELTYRCNTMFADSIPQFIGQEKPGGAYEWSLNFTIGIERWDRSIAPTPLPPVTEFMRLTFDTSLGDGTVVLPLRGTVDVLVDWDDGETSTWDTSADLTHTYAVEGEYTAKIRGTLSQFGKTTAWTGVEQLTGCTTFGGLGLVALPGAFRDAVNLTVIPSSTTSTSIVSMAYMLNGATSYDGVELASWDIEPLTDATFCLDGSGLSTASWNQVLLSLGNQVYAAGGIPASITFGALGLVYDSTDYGGVGQFTDALSARAYLINTTGWTLTDTLTFGGLTFTTDDYVEDATATGLPAQGVARTLLVWEKTAAAVQYNHVMIALGTGTTNYFSLYRWTNIITVLTTNDRKRLTWRTLPRQANTWECYIVTYDGDSTAIGYTTRSPNGVALVERVADQPFTYPLVGNSDKIRLGASLTNSAYLVGSTLTQAAVYTGEWTPANVLSYFNDLPTDLTAWPVSGCTLAAYYPMYPGSGQICEDVSGNRNDAQLGSDPGADSNDPTWAGPYTSLSGGPS